MDFPFGDRVAILFEAIEGAEVPHPRGACKSTAMCDEVAVRMAGEVKAVMLRDGRPDSRELDLAARAWVADRDPVDYAAEWYVRFLSENTVVVPTKVALEFEDAESGAGRKVH